MTSIKKIFVGALLSCALMPTLSYAQTEDQATPTMKAIVYADVKLKNIQVNQGTTTLSGSYAIQSRKGQQNDIHVGLVIADGSGKIIDTVPLKTSFSLREGEEQAGTFSYDIPTYLSGEIKFTLKAETEEGLPLAASLLDTRTLSGKGQVVTCAFDSEDSAVTCTSKANTSLEVAYGKGGLFTKTGTAETKELKKGETLSFTPQLGPGRYVAHIKTKEGESYSLVFILPGDYASIANVMIESKKEGEIHAVIIARTSASNATVAINLGDSCGSGSAPLQGGAGAELTLQSSCTEGTVQVDLLAADGTKLASASEPFSVIPVNAAKESSVNDKLLYGLAAFLGLALLVYAYRKFFGSDSGVSGVSNQTNPPMDNPAPESPAGKTAVLTMLFFALLFSGSTKANAESIMLFYICGGSTPCPQASTIFVTIDFSGLTSYLGDYTAPGDTAQITSYITSDDNPQLLDNSCGQTACVAPYVRAAYDSTSYGSDLYPSNYTQQQARDVQYGQYPSFTVPANSSLGTHYVYYSAGSAGYQTVTGSFPVTLQQYCNVSRSIYSGEEMQENWTTSILPGETFTAPYAPMNSLKYQSSCVGRGGASCPASFQGTNVVYTCTSTYQPPTVDVRFSLFEKMFKVFALGN